jgi:hypothetical protein
MPASTSHITSLTADYDSIEHAIRETSRGRWFLHCYLERNRSAETKLLLNAISKLESAMRENGQALQSVPAFDSLMILRDALDQARSEMAHLPRIEHNAVELPLRRFNFESVPAAIAKETQIIRDAAASIQSAAYALQAAGVFQGVAKQIAERADAIEHACSNQEILHSRADRMASLLSELEAELMNAFDDDRSFSPNNGNERDVSEFGGERSISDELVEEISAALYNISDDEDYRGPSKA